MTDDKNTDNVYNKEIFLRAFELVKNPTTFTTKAFARDGTGESVDAYDRNAICWCSAGALIKVINSIFNETTPNEFFAKGGVIFEFEQFIKTMKKVQRSKDNTLFLLNDNLPHKDVVKFWEEFGQFKGYI